MRDAKIEIWNVFFRGPFRVGGYFLLQTMVNRTLQNTKPSQHPQITFSQILDLLFQVPVTFFYSMRLSACRDQTSNPLGFTGPVLGFIYSHIRAGTRRACPLNCLTIQNLAAHFAHHTKNPSTTALPGARASFVTPHAPHPKKKSAQINIHTAAMRDSANGLLDRFARPSPLRMPSAE